MKKVVLVYDDSIAVSGRIRTIIGNRPYGKIVLKRQSLFTRVKNLAKKSIKDIEIKYVDNVEKFKTIEKAEKDAVFFHLFSSAAVLSAEDFNIIVEKAPFVNDVVVIRSGEKIHGVIISGREKYLEFLDEYFLQKSARFINGDVIETNCFVDISDYNNLLLFISSGFDARFFNSLVGDEYTVTKRSKDKRKMLAEYKYYWLIPERMRSFMVMPYDYKEDAEIAQYTMERMPMTDIAIRWTHGAVDLAELDKILDKTFYFFKSRETKSVSKDEFLAMANDLYIEKVRLRTEALKKLPEFKEISQLISSGTEYGSIDEIMNEYYALYGKISTRIFGQKPYLSVIGHGDVFFANMLYSKEANILRLIDPKGATEESQLWTNPYYDVAKLSHSICGNYDFFNTGSYDIELAKDMHFRLQVFTDNTKAKELFKEYLENNGYDYIMVRLCEASLFLSMLPLHIDNPHKVFGFILNAISILKEIEVNV